MVELLTSLTHMLDKARQRAAGGSVAPQPLHQLVLILADGRFHEKESLRRVVAVRRIPPCSHCAHPPSTHTICCFAVLFRLGKGSFVKAYMGVRNTGCGHAGNGC